ncbi:MAG TPA: hypothetical protein VLZ06_06685 [Solirubrobacteraceae bacterium]|nr:hypothetical protein [Solirubrobacteraceae bacterium]
MAASAIFPRMPAEAGGYESFYLRAVSPSEPVGVWIRYTAHKRPGHPPLGSVWCTVFDAQQGRPFMHKLTTPELGVPPGGWIQVGSGDPGSRFGPGHARGVCGPASWELRFHGEAPELRHLPREWLYRTPLPRTKLTSPAPDAVFEGSVELQGGRTFALDGWRGMVGHNWGSEHAERWIWLHGIGFGEAPDAWLDLALGRVRIVGRMTPWIASGGVSLDGRLRRLGGLGARGLEVREDAAGCSLTVPGAGRTRVHVRVAVPEGSAAGWRYADPDGSEHDVVNCSIAALELGLTEPGAAVRELTTAHGGAYELGMRERDHGVPIAPFPDGVAS